MKTVIVLNNDQMGQGDNALGQKIRILVDHQQSAPGSHQVEWNGKDNAGNMVGSGVYYYRLQAGDSQITRKMMLLK